MSIAEVEVIALNKSEQPINLKFNNDINIITGRNGSGKTTLLKLMWYCISGNIERAIREVVFSKIRIVTSKYILIVEITKFKDQEVVHVIVELPDGSTLLDKKEPVGKEDIVERANMLTVELLSTSVFFPTFRRIEGGFSMTDKQGIRSFSRGSTRRVDSFIRDQQNPFGNKIQEALEAHAGMLSVGSHQFVSSISTVDIRQLVTRKHSAATTMVDLRSKKLSDNILAEIRDWRETNSKPEDALREAVFTLDKINQDVDDFEKKREEAFKSLTILSEIIVTIFKHKGIRLNPRVTLGDIEESINSDSLSAGEKQMLSFLCYNALYSDCPFFIDEPELSLHVDWQRILLEVLTEQNTNNQMFIATHSPFIYTQYEDKEIMLGDDRGYENG